MYPSPSLRVCVNVVHCFTRSSLEQVRACCLRARRVRVSLETCPQYLLLTIPATRKAGRDGFAGAGYVMSPPLRKLTDIGWQLREAVADGEVDD